MLGCNKALAIEFYFFNLVKQRLTYQFIQNWNSRLNDSTCALFYRNFHWGTKLIWPLLLLVNSDLHSPSHRLEVETGRWARPTAIPFEERRCTSCHSLEDEFHFVLECSRYNDLRTIDIPSYYRRRPNMLKLVELFQSENKKLR